MARIESTVQPGPVSGASGAPRGDLLEDRIRSGLTGCVAEQTAIALQIARALQQLHRKGKHHGRIRSGSVFLDEENRVAFDGIPNSDQSLLGADIRGFGLVLYELFSGRILEEHELAKSPDVEPLHKAGITPRLVEVVKQCLSEQDRPPDLENCTKDLENLLRQMVGETAGTIDKGRVFAAVSFGVALIAVIVWAMFY